MSDVNLKVHAFIWDGVHDCHCSEEICIRRVMKYPRHIFCGLRQIIQMALPYKRHTILLQRLSKNGYKPRMHIIVAHPLWCPILPPFMGISNLLSQATISGVMTAHLFVHNLPCGKPSLASKKEVTPTSRRLRLGLQHFKTRIPNPWTGRQGLGWGPPPDYPF